MEVKWETDAMEDQGLKSFHIGLSVNGMELYRGKPRQTVWNRVRCKKSCKAWQEKCQSIAKDLDLKTGNKCIKEKRQGSAGDQRNVEKIIKTKGKGENLLQEAYSSKCLKCQSDKNITFPETT